MCFFDFCPSLIQLALAPMRSVKDCAKAWQMEPVLWMFQDSQEVDSDVEMMLECRNQFIEDFKHAEKLLLAQRSSDMFAREARKVKAVLSDGQAHPEFKFCLLILKFSP